MSISCSSITQGSARSFLGISRSWPSVKGSVSKECSTKITDVSVSRSPIGPRERIKCPHGYTESVFQLSILTTILIIKRQQQLTNMLGEILRLQYSIGRFRTDASSKKVNKKTNKQFTLKINKQPRYSLLCFSVTKGLRSNRWTSLSVYVCSTPSFIYIFDLYFYTAYMQLAYNVN